MTATAPLADRLHHAECGQAAFDLVVFDLTPPDSPARGLFSPEFFQQLKTILARPALISAHLGAPLSEPERVRRIWRDLSSAFRLVRVMTAEIPVYGGLWAMALASDGAYTGDGGFASGGAIAVRNAQTLADPAALMPEHVAAMLAARDIGGLRYYNAARHAALFVPPTCLCGLIEP